MRYQAFGNLDGLSAGIPVPGNAVCETVAGLGLSGLKVSREKSFHSVLVGTRQLVERNAATALQAGVRQSKSRQPARALYLEIIHAGTLEPFTAKVKQFGQVAVSLSW